MRAAAWEARKTKRGRVAFAGRAIPLCLAALIGLAGAGRAEEAGAATGAAAGGSGGGQAGTVVGTAEGRAEGTVARPQGLLWNRSGLPLTFPLQVKSSPGRDFYLLLLDAESGRAVLAAYVRGGGFFRVLVPPGDYRLHLATGREWQGEAALFGPGTEVFALAPTLRFEVTGPGRKAGHLVDLTGLAEGAAAQVSDRALCSGYRLDPRSLRAAWPLPGAWPGGDPAAPRAGSLPRFPAPDWEIRPRLCD